MDGSGGDAAAGVWMLLIWDPRAGSLGLVPTTLSPWETSRPAASSVENIIHE